LNQLTAVGGVDILVGIPTLNNSKTIGRVASAAQVGLVKYFPRARAVLILPDGGSRDSTPEAVKRATVQDFRSLLTPNPLHTIHRLTTSYPGMQGYGSAVRIVLAAADLLRAKACALISPDLESMTPGWIESLIRPVYTEQVDYVTPVYHRHKFDGLLIKNLVSPMMGAVYRYKVREPVGGELGFSGRFACHCLAQPVWHEEVVRQGVEVWMTAQAMRHGFRLCQSFLGPKIHAPQSTGRGLVETLRRVVGALFHSMEAHESYWLSHSGSQSVPSFGFEYSVALESVRVNKQLMMKMLRSGVDQLASILEVILTAETFQEIQGVAKLGDRDFIFPDDLWVKTAYEFACAYHRSVINRDHLLQALTPLYRGRMASFMLENSRADGEEIEMKLDQLSTQYERLRPHLDHHWGPAK
jgi:hypothetical protein